MEVFTPSSHARRRHRLTTCLAAGGRGGAIPGADVVPSSQPERVPHRRTQLCQLAVLLTPEEALPETTVSLSLKDNSQTTPAIFKK